jgi:integrase
MGSRKLTAAFCDAVQPVEGRQVAYPDEDVRGLELRVSGDGRKAWSYRYRTRFGRQGRVTLGLHSDQFGLRDARVAARRLQQQVIEGADPAMEARAAKITVTQEPLSSLADLAEAYFRATERGRYRPKRASSLSLERQVYRVHIERRLGRLPLELVTRRTVKGALEQMVDQGAPAQAVRVQAILRQMLSYAVAEERLPFNPIRDLPPVAASRARARTYSDEELRSIWTGVLEPEALSIPEHIANRRRDADRVRISRPMRIAIQLVFLLLQRRCEVLGMRRSELDLKHGVWTIPAERMKSKRRHAVPLSPWAVGLIEEALRLAAERHSPFVFPGLRDAGKPMNGPSMNWAFNAVLWARGIEDGTIHDLRRTGSTLMTSERIGVSPFIRSQILGHNDSGGGARISATHYDANSYIKEKRRALERWQILLRAIVGADAGDASSAYGARFDAVSPFMGGHTLSQPIPPREAKSPELGCGPLFEWGNGPRPTGGPAKPVATFAFVREP